MSLHICLKSCTINQSVNHSLTVIVCIHHKILFVVSKPLLYDVLIVLKFVFDYMRNPLFASSYRTLRFSDNFDLLVSRTWTALAQRLYFSFVGSLLGIKSLKSYTTNTFRFTFFLELKSTESASVWLTP